MRNLVRLCSLLIATCTAACSSDGENNPNGSGGTGNGGSGGAPVECDLDYDSIASDTAPVSFETDVMPIFQNSCNFSSCHNVDDRRTAAQLKLGPKNDEDVTAADVETVLANLIGVASKTALEAPRVDPGNPAGSFLIQKLAGTQNDHGYACTPQDPSTTDCGEAMPWNSPPLCEQTPGGQDRFNIIVRWVSQVTAPVPTGDAGTTDGG